MKSASIVYKNLKDNTDIMTQVKGKFRNECIDRIEEFKDTILFHYNGGVHPSVTVFR